MINEELKFQYKVSWQDYAKANAVFLLRNNFIKLILLICIVNIPLGLLVLFNITELGIDNPLVNLFVGFSAVITCIVLGYQLKMKFENSPEYASEIEYHITNQSISLKSDKSANEYDYVSIMEISKHNSLILLILKNKIYFFILIYGLSEEEVSFILNK